MNCSARLTRIRPLIASNHHLRQDKLVSNDETLAWLVFQEIETLGILAVSQPICERGD